MVARTDLECVLVALLAIGVLGAAGPGASLAQFSDDHAGTGAATAASNFGGKGGGDDVRAFDDANGNGIRDDGEATYSKQELQNFDDPDVDLVVPAGVGSIRAKGQDEVSITAGSISSEVDVGAHKQDVRLVATDGDVDVAGSNLTVDKQYGTIDVSASGDVDLSDATLLTESGSIAVEAGGSVDLRDSVLRVEGANGDVAVTARSVTAEGATVDTVTGTVRVTATDGPTELAGATLTVDRNYGEINVSASGDVGLPDATLLTESGSIAVESGGAVTLDEAVLRIEGDDGRVSVAGRSVSATSVDADTGTGDVEMTATEGTAELTDATLAVDGGYGAVLLSGTDDVDLTGAAATTNAGRIRAEAADGPLAATGANLTVAREWGGIELRSVGNATLDSATLTTANGSATVGLGTGSATLFVENVTVEDGDGTLEYSPANVTERPDRDDVVPAG
ncbi:hypothetical protein [Halomicrobium salinisoli]|uniref:hypothetical protein n=1 Tax=Halomicrobium salinisoli TaxID=2878391 RepID=UPI001CF0563A|nr:hypothetical protein [Halomicrobium salinisoli]